MFAIIHKQGKGNLITNQKNDKDNRNKTKSKVLIKKSVECQDGHEMELLKELPKYGVWCGDCFDWIRDDANRAWYCVECDYGLCRRCEDQ